MVTFKDPIRIEAITDVGTFQCVLAYLYPADVFSKKQQDVISYIHLDSLWIAQSGGMPVGRLAVYKNYDWGYQELDTYCIGHYECAADDWVAAYLFKTVLKYIRHKQGAYVMGSIQDTIDQNGEYTAKPEYYALQWQMAGFEEITSCDQYLPTLYASKSDAEMPSRILYTFFGQHL